MKTEKHETRGAKHLSSGFHSDTVIACCLGAGYNAPKVCHLVSWTWAGRFYFRFKPKSHIYRQTVFEPRFQSYGWSQAEKERSVITSWPCSALTVVARHSCAPPCFAFPVSWRCLLSFQLWTNPPLTTASRGYRRLFHDTPVIPSACQRSAHFLFLYFFIKV